jgi:DNA-binding NtrC family response regulator
MRFPLGRGTTKIGRDSECDITLAGETLSRIHLLLFESEGSYFAKNIGRTPLQHNGKIVESAPLQEGDRLNLADWEITFSHENDVDWSRDETYVSHAAGEGTQLLHASVCEGRLVADRISLKIREPQKAPRVHNIHQEVTTLGKGPTCDIRLSDSYCSDLHCKLIVKGGRILIFDVNSTNGTFVNDVRVKEADLEEGTIIRVGQTELVLELTPEQKEAKPLEEDTFGPLVGRSQAMRELFRLIQQVAPTPATVCIFGETGTGKELVARALHDLSPRALKPWMALNCGAISRELIESELFGHEKGAFTGAHQQRRGAFEQAHGGTLFLDEIGELPLDLQPNLLRVLETGKLRRVGGNQEIPVDVRILCATHRDLSQLVSHGKFREDLFFRLYVFPLFIPPLRQRREDILLITEHFLRQMTPNGKKVRFTPDGARSLETREWRGNVRELKNTLQRAIILASSGEIGVEHLQLPGSFQPSDSRETPDVSFPNTSNLEQLEREIILRELRAHGGNRLAAAKALGIAKSILYEKLKVYGIQE